MKGGWGMKRLKVASIMFVMKEIVRLDKLKERYWEQHSLPTSGYSGSKTHITYTCDP